MKKNDKEGMEKFSPEARIEEYLKKPMDTDSVRREAERGLGVEESKRIAREQMTKKASLWDRTRWERAKESLARHFYWRVGMARKLGGRKFLYETLPLVVFSSFAVYIAWQMEDRLDRLKRKVVRVKTLREEESERENRELGGALSGNQSFEDMPISSRNDPIAKYRIDIETDPEQAGLIQSPDIEFAQSDLSPEEMSTMMKQYQAKTASMKGTRRLLPDPGYSEDPETNRKNRDSKRPSDG